MADIASLIIRITTAGASRASSELGGLAKAALAAGAAIGGLEAARQVFDSLVASQRNFDKLNSALITMTGSAENAAKAFQVLQQFAKETPYGLNQAVEGFTKLVALGLNPSKEALISYGNTAAAMGKDLNQMIEAVADATTGEFERLKEFGIKSKSEGDNISFTFQGVTTTVKKNSEEIQKYLLNIGNTNFAGAMEIRSKTLDGALSSLEDTVAGLTLSIAQSGFGDIMIGQAQRAETAIQSLTDAIASGEVIDGIRDFTTVFEESFKFISDELNELAFDARDSTGDMKDSGEDAASSIANSFESWLPTIQQFFRDIYAEFEAADMRARATGQAIKAALTPGDSAAATYNSLMAAAQLQLDMTKAANQAEADGIRERSAARQKETDERRKAYDERRKQEIDLATLVKNPPGKTDNGSSGTDDKAAKAAAKLAEQQRKQAESFMDSVKRQNQDELKAIDEQERQKLAKLDEFQKLGALRAGEYEATKTQILLDAEAQRQEELKKRQDERDKNQFQADSYLEQIRAENEGELQEIDRQQAEKLRKLDEFHNKGLVSESDYQQAVRDIVDTADQERLDSYTNTLSSMTNALRSSLGEGNALYKAAAITQTLIETYKGATAAYASLATIPIIGPGLGIAAAAAVTAAGLANVGKIRSAREQGGQLYAGQMSTIAERGQPEVIMPAGASRVRTAQQMRQIMGENGGANAPSNIQIVNQTTGRVDSVTTEQTDENRLRVIIRETVSGDLADSNSTISKTRRGTRGKAGH